MVWARGAPLNTLSQSPAASGHQEGDGCQALRDFALRGEGGRSVTMPAKKPHSKGGVGTGGLQRGRYVACPLPGCVVESDLAVG